MIDSHSDALVFFGATGDLAYKKIFPALQGMLKRGSLDVPKERWISYPGCERGADGSLPVAWAGWTHLQQATARRKVFLGDL